MDPRPGVWKESLGTPPDRKLSSFGAESEQVQVLQNSLWLERERASVAEAALGKGMKSTAGPFRSADALRASTPPLFAIKASKSREGRKGFGGEATKGRAFSTRTPPAKSAAVFIRPCDGRGSRGLGHGRCQGSPMMQRRSAGVDGYKEGGGEGSSQRQPEGERKDANVGGDCGNEDEYPFMKDFYAFPESDLGEEEPVGRSFILEGFGERQAPEDPRTASTPFQRWKHARGIWSPGVAEILDGNGRRISR